LPSLICSPAGAALSSRTRCDPSSRCALCYRSPSCDIMHVSQSYRLHASCCSDRHSASDSLSASDVSWLEDVLSCRHGTRRRPVSTRHATSRCPVALPHHTGTRHVWYLTIIAPLVMWSLVGTVFLPLPSQPHCCVPDVVNCYKCHLLRESLRLLSQVRMRDPVIATDGLTYERSAIEGWFATQGGGPPRSPVTGQLVPSASVLPNLAIRELIQHQR